MNTLGALYGIDTDISNRRSIEIQISDTAGQKQYRVLDSVYFRSAAAAVLVFDVTSQRSFESLIDWLTLLRSSNNNKALIFVVGNKIEDL
jgi:Ras-related protein Rab-11A